MVNRSKGKGTAFESECVKMFKAAGLESRRLALSGTADKGDVEVVTRLGNYVVECKCYKSWSRGDVERWRKEAEAELRNYHDEYGGPCYCALVVSQYNKSNADSYVHVKQNHSWVQMYLDEFIGLLAGSGRLRTEAGS